MVGSTDATRDIHGSRGVHGNHGVHGSRAARVGRPRAVRGRGHPWEDEDWRAAAFAWAERELGRHGLRATGTREVRVRPWSVLVRFRTGPGERDAVWFKAGAPDNAFEAPSATPSRGGCPTTS